jgi:hypothetical protein
MLPIELLTEMVPILVVDMREVDFFINPPNMLEVGAGTAFAVGA